MRICSECRKEITRDYDFCPFCGSKNIEVIGIDQLAPGYEVVMTNNGPIVVNVKYLKKISFAFIFSVLIGLFGLCGIGQVVLKKYIRGFLFLTASIILYYLRFFSNMGEYADYYGLASNIVFILMLVDLYLILRKTEIPIS